MTLVRNVLYSFLTRNLRHYELAIVPIRNDERELEWRYSFIIHHSSPSLYVDQIGTVDSAMTRTPRCVGLLGGPYEN